MPIKIFNEQHKIKLDVRKIRKYLPRIEKKLHLSKNGIYNIIFIDDRNIEKLNKIFRDTDRPTDVLSFKNSGKDADIFISIETAKDNAKFYKQDFYTEILRLVIHGILHAGGFTDYTEKSKKNMWEKQEKILKCLH
ncbi:MAG: rRNA maturation RNase YbeY [Elusimicrobiota bacterium]|nr:rRNA maturation RNase YbeY [Elusimicrobiota bacterium]